MPALTAGVGRCMRRYRHREFVRFLNGVGVAVPAGRLVPALPDDRGTREHPKVAGPFVRTADPGAIVEPARRGYHAPASIGRRAG